MSMIFKNFLSFCGGVRGGTENLKLYGCVCMQFPSTVGDPKKRKSFIFALLKRLFYKRICDVFITISL